MATISMTVEDVKEARRRAWLGESVKEIAREMGLTYGPVWSAVRGRTWASIVEPPPVPTGYEVVSFRVCLNRLCGDIYQGRPRNGLCAACYSYRRRHGERRDAAQVGKGQGRRIEIEDLDELWQAYEDGASLEDLVDGRRFSNETLRRKLHEAGYELRDNNAWNRVLEAPIVRQARVLVHEDGLPVNEVAEAMDLNYQTLYAAVSGYTWRRAGGPLPAGDSQTEEEQRKCGRCGLLTSQRLCRYCREEI